MLKAGYCEVCKKNVWLKENGSCEKGHPPNVIRGTYETETKAKKSRSSNTSLIVILTVVAALVFSCVVCNFFGSLGRNQSRPESQKKEAEVAEPKEKKSSSKEEKPKNLSLGQSANGDVWQYTVRDFRIVDEINEHNNPYMIARPGEGFQYLIATLEIKNITKETQDMNFLSGLDLKLKTNDGKTFKQDELSDAEMALANPLSSKGDVPPDGVVTGDAAFKITAGLTDFTLEIGGEEDMVWNLKK